MNMPYPYSTLILADTTSERGHLKDTLRQLLPGSINTLPVSTPLQKAMHDHKPDLLLVELGTDSSTGLNQLRQFHTAHDDGLSIAIVPEGDRDLAIKAMHAGAQSYIASPLHTEEIKLVINRALQASSFDEQDLREHKLRESDGFHGIVGNTDVMRELFELISRIGEEGESTILLQRGKWGGQRIGRPGAARLQPTRRAQFCPRQLRGHSGQPSGKRTLRL